MRSFRVAAAAVAAISALSACGGSQTAAHGRSGEIARHQVKISNFSFHPPAITVQAGARITFANQDRTAHTATGTNGSFDTGTIPAGGTRTLTFTKPGVYTYYCQFHAFMHGEIVVK